MIVKTMIKAIRARESTASTSTSTSTDGIASLEYWRGHDMTTNNVANTGAS